MEKEKVSTIDKKKNYDELEKAVINAFGFGEGIGTIAFRKILEEMPKDHSYDVYGFAGWE